MASRTALLAIGIAGVVGLATAEAVGWATRFVEIPPIAKPDPASFDRKRVERGATLAALGDCDVCHTKSGGKPYAGGRPLETPFGVIYTTNITPDPETGIGSWSEAAFLRAMREGVDRNGHYLYPAFPYDYFAKVSEADLKAIYAFLMSRGAVTEKTPETTLSFPFNNRLLMAGWNTLFLERGEFRENPAKDAEWNRGAYLVEGLGHCGACHTPRDVFGAAPKSGPTAYAGAAVEGWWAPALSVDPANRLPWTVKSLVNYLIDGWDGQHGIAAGPMTAVVNDLHDQSEDDVFAIAAYVMSLKGAPRPQAELDARTATVTAYTTKVEWGHPDSPKPPEDPLLRRGATIFESQCASCHKSGGNPAPLALTNAVNAPSPETFVRVTLQGIQPPRGVLDRSMPGRALQINDEDMVALAAFVRTRFTKMPAWKGIDAMAKKVRAEKP
jgi:mono/diheme cytochrome c family protein